MNKYIKEFTKGITLENPTFVLILGLCPTLAVSTTLVNAIGMGVAATFVLFGSNVIVSLLRKFIPDRIRIPCFIVIIATFVTMTELFMKAFSPQLSRALGIFVPLIVVNCIVLGRAEAFASRRPVSLSAIDALGMGAGFTFALCIIAAIREILGNGTILGFSVIPGYRPALFMIFAPGALFTIGMLIAFFRWIKVRR
ncbi:MAG: electron transport complex subunit E [Candidatus Omnitrophota bacterium]